MRFLATLLMAALGIVGVGFIYFPIRPSFFFQTIALLFIGAMGIYFYLVEVKNEKPKYFVQLYLLTLVVKLLAYGAYILFVVWDDPSQALENALHFMVTYALFTAIEIGFLYRKVKR